MKKFILSSWLVASACLGKGFVANTPIKMKVGHQWVQHIRAGDTVISTDIMFRLYQSAIFDAKPLGIFLVYEIRNYYGETVYAANDQEFYVVGQGWTKAEEIKPKDRIIHIANHCGSKVKTVRKIGWIPTYGLMIEGENNVYANGFLALN